MTTPIPAPQPPYSGQLCTRQGLAAPHPSRKNAATQADLHPFTLHRYLDSANAFSENHIFYKPGYYTSVLLFGTFLNLY
jgi:hypothetical protein